jgi:hypothetical protein
MAWHLTTFPMSVSDNSFALTSNVDLVPPERR